MSPTAAGQSSERSFLSSLVRWTPHTLRLRPTAEWSPSRYLEDCAARNPNSLAIAFLDERYTWREVDERANQYANFFHQQGIIPGDVVAVMLDNRPDYLFILHGLTRLGGVAALINTNLTDASLAHAIRVSKAKHILAGSEHAHSISLARKELEGAQRDGEMWVQVDPESSSDDASAPSDHLPERARAIDAEVAALSTSKPATGHRPKSKDLFCYIYTSGTTGLPKAAVISNLRMMGANSSFGLLVHRTEPGELIYVTLPLYHSSALFLGWGAALASGAGIALRRKFSASNFWKDVRTYRASTFIYIGELCRYLLNTPVQAGEDDHQLRLGAGNGLRPDIWGEFQQRFGVPLIREFYGATEGNSAIINLEGRPGMVGKLAFGAKLLRCDPETGEPIRNANGLCESAGVGEKGLFVAKITSIGRFEGYSDEAATQKKVLADVFKKGDRYFNSGDLLELHEGRWLSFADRVGDTFRWKGENVSTNEVAEVLNGAAGIAESNVYGVVVPRADGRAGMAALNITANFDLDAFAKFVLENLPNYQRPRFIRLLKEEMNTTGTFKHQKVQYRKEAFDPSQIDDPLYFLAGDRYVPVDAALLAGLEDGSISPS